MNVVTKHGTVYEECLGEEACFHFIKLMLEMPYSITMSMLATCIETYSEITGISVYNLLATIAEAYEKRKEGGLHRW